jgi:hypothetical protein
MAEEAAVHCPTCGATWGPIAAYQCDGPRDAPHPRVRTVPGPPPAPRRMRAVVTPQEMSAAADLLEDLDGALTRHGRIAMVAAALADVREGATIPGERQLVGQHLDVSVRAWRDVPYPDTQQLMLRGTARRAWAAKLEAEGLRPLGWPPVVTTYLRWRATDGTEQPPTIGDPMVECDEGRADLVRLTVRGLAVPA